jgi:hypothetical protein
MLYDMESWEEPKVYLASVLRRLFDILHESNSTILNYSREQRILVPYHTCRRNKTSSTRLRKTVSFSASVVST